MAHELDRRAERIAHCTAEQAAPTAKRKSEIFSVHGSGVSHRGWLSNA
jgi:hypothetical protein